MQDTNNVLNIVIIEDNEMDSSLLEAKLKEKVNYNTKVYTNSDLLFKYMDDKNNVDVVILDDELPDRDSYDLLQKIKRKNPMVDIIILSNKSDSKYTEKLIGAGAYDYVIKDKNAVDKIINHIDSIRNNWKIKTENAALHTKAKKSQSSVYILLFILVCIFAAAVYFIFGS